VVNLMSVETAPVEVDLYSAIAQKVAAEAAVPVVVNI